MKKVLDIPLDNPLEVIGLSADAAKALMPTRVIRDTDKVNFEDLFKKIAVAAHQGKDGLRMNFQQQKMTSHYKKELQDLGYQIVETDIKWSAGDKIAYDKMLSAEDATYIDTLTAISNAEVAKKAAEELRIQQEKEADELRLKQEQEAKEVAAREQRAKEEQAKKKDIVQEKTEPEPEEKPEIVSNDKDEPIKVPQPAQKPKKKKKGFFGNLLDKAEDLIPGGDNDDEEDK